MTAVAKCPTCGHPQGFGAFCSNPFHLRDGEIASVLHEDGFVKIAVKEDTTDGR